MRVNLSWLLECIFRNNSSTYTAVWHKIDLFRTVYTVRRVYALYSRLCVRVHLGMIAAVLEKINGSDENSFGGNRRQTISSSSVENYFLQRPNYAH